MAQAYFTYFVTSTPFADALCVGETVFVPVVSRARVSTPDKGLQPTDYDEEVTPRRLPSTSAQKRECHARVAPAARGLGISASRISFSTTPLRVSPQRVAISARRAMASGDREKWTRGRLRSVAIVGLRLGPYIVAVGVVPPMPAAALAVA
jgi:hypothetical protein